MLKQLFLTTVGFATFASAQSSITVPTTLLLASNRSPLELATLLGDAAVPSGFEVKQFDDGRPRTPPDFTFDRATRAPITDLIQAFNSTHHEYRAELMDGVFVVRPTAGAVRFLDEPAPIQGHVRVVGVMNAARLLLAPLDRSLSSTGALAGSVIGPPVDRGESTTIELNGDEGRKVIDSFNQIAAQSRRSWLVLTRQDGATWRIVRFGFIHTQGLRIGQDLTQVR
jgi:hypothetical protein